LDQETRRRVLSEDTALLELGLSYLDRALFPNKEASGAQ
jgi:hypothetical protein